jgi:hypothetical protein
MREDAALIGEYFLLELIKNFNFTDKVINFLFDKLTNILPFYFIYIFRE